MSSNPPPSGNPGAAKAGATPPPQREHGDHVEQHGSSSAEAAGHQGDHHEASAPAASHQQPHATNEPRTPTSRAPGAHEDSGADFACSVCFGDVVDPVVTKCGHFMCWECLRQWVEVRGNPCCPICRGGISMQSDVIPIYGKGRTGHHAADNRGGGARGTNPSSGGTADASAPPAGNASPGEGASTGSFSSRPQAQRNETPQQPPQGMGARWAFGGLHTGFPLFFFAGGGFEMIFCMIVGWAVYYVYRHGLRGAWTRFKEFALSPPATFFWVLLIFTLVSVLFDDSLSVPQGSHVHQGRASTSGTPKGYPAHAQQAGGSGSTTRTSQARAKDIFTKR